VDALIQREDTHTHPSRVYEDSKTLLEGWLFYPSFLRVLVCGCVRDGHKEKTHSQTHPSNIVMNLFNIISAIALMIIFSRTKQKSDKQTYLSDSGLKKQIQEHKHLLICPIFIVSVKLLIVIVAFVNNCIRYQWQLVPLTANFIIFVLPAPSYVKIFNDKRQKTI
jgi:hypothetical protein